MIEFGGGLEPIPAALGFMTSPARFVMALTGRRGTKTYSGARKFVERIYRDVGDLAGTDAREQRKRAAGLPYNAALIYSPGAVSPTSAEYKRRKPRALYWIVADTYALLDETKAALFQVLPHGIIEGDPNASGRSVWLRPDILIVFKTGKVPNRLVGRGLNGVWLEEAARLAVAAWVEFLRPALADKRGWAIVTTTPLGEDWTFEHFEQLALAGDPAYAFFKWMTEDNPHIARQEIEDARLHLAPEFFEREFRASRAAFQGQIYKSWDTKFEHDALPEGIQFARVLGGVDWGISNPGAEEVVGITEAGHVWVFDEVYERSELVEDYWVPEGLKLQARHRFNEWVCDPAEPDNLRRFTRAGMRAVGHRNMGSGKFDEHARSILSGIRTQASLIHRGMLHVVKPKCPNFLRELRNYRWAQTPGGHWLEMPAPNQSDHALSAVRYAISYAIKPPVMRPL